MCLVLIKKLKCTYFFYIASSKGLTNCSLGSFLKSNRWQLKNQGVFLKFIFLFIFIQNTIKTYINSIKSLKNKKINQIKKIKIVHDLLFPSSLDGKTIFNKLLQRRETHITKIFFFVIGLWSTDNLTVFRRVSLNSLKPRDLKINKMNLQTKIKILKF